MQISLRGRSSGALVVSVVVAVLVAVGLPAGAQAQSPTADPADTIGIIKSDESPSNAEVAVRLSEATPLGEVSTVVVGRDDVFADSLASGVLQSTSPLLLVPPGGPVPDRVRAELGRLGPDRVLLLGGEAAISPAVADELAQLGYAVERRAGASRFETATAIAGTDAPTAATAILARAFPSAGATDPTQGFADALAAGGMAAEMGWPVLLTQTEVLTGATRDYLRDAGITEVKLMGGTAAISQAVEDELVAMGIATDRLAGGSRAETAVEVAKERGAETAADAAHVLLVQGQTADAWAGGFAAAAHSAVLDAPIVLAVETQLPPATTDWLAGGAQGGGAQAFAVDPSDGGPVLTCVTVPTLCEDARIALGLPPAGSAAGPELVSLAIDGSAAGGDFAAVDATGSTVAFISDGHVVADVPPGQRHIYVAQTADDGTTAYALVDVRPDGTPAQASQSFDPVDVSADGRYLAFTSGDRELATDGSTGGLGYLRDLATGINRLVNLGPDGRTVNQVSGLTVSDDGTAVAYRAQLPEGFGILHHDLVSGEVTPVTLPDGSLFIDGSGVGVPAMSGDGSTIAFYTDLPLLAEDTNDGGPDTYLFDVAQGTLEIVSVSSEGEQAASIGPNDDGRLGISRDGQVVAFWSNASNLAPGDDDDFDGGDVFVHDRRTGETRLLSADQTGAAIDIAQGAAISPDGRFAAFFGSGDLTGTGEVRCGVYRVELATGDLTRRDSNPLSGGNSCPTRLDLADTGAVVFDMGNPFTEADVNGRPDVHRSGDIAAPANLASNGGAESDAGREAAGSADNGAPTGWERPEGSELTFLPYGVGNYPTQASPGSPPGQRGTMFFNGGLAATSVGVQRVPLPADATRFALSAWLGGFGPQEDHALLEVQFLDAGAGELGGLVMGPVTVADRGGVTALHRRAAIGAVPAGATTAVLTLTAARAEGSANDGYADAISLQIR